MYPVWVGGKCIFHNFFCNNNVVCKTKQKIPEWTIFEQMEKFWEMCIWKHESIFFQPDISTSAKLFWNVNSFSQHPIWDICCHFLALNMLKGRGIIKWRQLQKIIDFLIKMWYHFFRGVIEKWPYRWPMGGRVKKISKWRCRHLLIAPLKYLHT